MATAAVPERPKNYCGSVTFSIFKKVVPMTSTAIGIAAAIREAKEESDSKILLGLEIALFFSSMVAEFIHIYARAYKLKRYSHHAAHVTNSTGGGDYTNVTLNGDVPCGAVVIPIAQAVFATVVGAVGFGIGDLITKAVLLGLAPWLLETSNLSDAYGVLTDKIEHIRASFFRANQNSAPALKDLDNEVLADTWCRSRRP